MKFYVRTISPLFLLVVLSLCGSQQAFGLCGKRSRKAPAEQRDTTKSSAYDKFFKEEHRIARGLFTLHEMKGRVYFEIPLRLMDRSMLLGTTISATSDNGHGIVGSKPKDPLHFAFTRAGDRIAMRLISERTVSPPLPDHAEIGRALATSNIGAIYRLFKIETFTPDSSAVVVDATNLFVSDDERLSPFDKYSQHTLSGRLKRKESFEKEKSYVTGIKSFSDNVSVSSSLNYRVTISERGLRDVPVTIAATRSILLLDSLPVSPRITDSRIAVFPTGKMLYSPTTQGARPIWYANRWRLEPSDIEAYRRGELVDPIKPIVFYIDRNFPRTWLPYVIEGVNQWSELFEQIGFRNAVQARLFPEDDPEFDPDNLKYSCVRYAPVTIQNAMGPSWTDPRSGEIVSASVYLYHDVIELINNWLFIQTSPADPRVRQKQIPQEIIGDALRYVLSHEIGHCLGFMHNMGASSVIPVDSLRSPSFTRETGTTPSIMDYARFNYVAQPGDFERGVRMTPPRFGVYDRFLVKWNYTPLFAGSPEAEYAITSQWLREASADPALRYGKQQFSEPLDPRSLSEDLGDDHVRASEYGISNLKYVLSHLNAWTESDDRDYSYRKTIYNGIVNQYFTYLNHVYADVGGVYLYEKHVGDSVEHYRSVPRERQVRALEFLLGQLDDMEWLDDRSVTGNLGLVASAADAVCEAVMKAVVASPSKVGLSAALAENDAFTPEACMSLIYDRIWAPTLRRKALSLSQIKRQRLFLETLGKVAALREEGNSKSLAAMRRMEVPEAFRTDRSLLPNASAGCPGPVAGYDDPMPLFYEERPMEGLAYDCVLKIRRLLEGQRNHPDLQTRLHYRSLLHTIESYLK